MLKSFSSLVVMALAAGALLAGCCCDKNPCCDPCPRPCPAPCPKPCCPPPCPKPCCPAPCPCPENVCY